MWYNMGKCIEKWIEALDKDRMWGIFISEDIIVFQTSFPHRFLRDS